MFELMVSSRCAASQHLLWQTMSNKRWVFFGPFPACFLCPFACLLHHWNLVSLGWSLSHSILYAVGFKCKPLGDRINSGFR